MKVGVVDIGTNSMRLLITDGAHEETRRAVVTGLGRGVDATGLLGSDEIEASVTVLREFGGLMTEAGVAERAAVATSASRDASNRLEFIERATEALGVSPVVIDGTEEGQLAYEGAVSDLEGDSWLVTDIGGGSTEFATARLAKSVDIGSIRLSDRVLTDRPPTRIQLEEATAMVRGLFEPLRTEALLPVVGVAGTWTTLAIMVEHIASFQPGAVHKQQVSRSALGGLMDELANLSVEETVDRFPGIDPKRAPAILAGSVIAACVLNTFDAESVLASERDSLDGLAQRLLALA